MTLDKKDKTFNSISTDAVSGAFSGISLSEDQQALDNQTVDAINSTAVQSVLGKQPLGHSGVLLIDNKSGLTKYYEYGRYPTEDGTKGLVRNVAVLDVVMGTDGMPTQESLNKVLSKISEQSGHSGDINGAYIKSDKFKKMNDYAKEKLNESNAGKTGYKKDREPYTLTGNNCATFASDVLKKIKT